MAEVNKIRVFNSEQSNFSHNADESCGVARVGDATPRPVAEVEVRPGVMVRRRMPRLPVQLVVKTYDQNGNLINDPVYNGKKLANGRTVRLTWRAEMVNERVSPDYSWSGAPPRPDDAAHRITETSTPGNPAPKLGFHIDETGLFMPGTDTWTPHGTGGIGFDFDNTANGDVYATYEELDANGTVVKGPLQDKAHCLIGPPDWTGDKDDLLGNQWSWPQP